MFRCFVFAASILLISACNKRSTAILLYNGSIYTVDSAFSVAESMVIDQGKITFVGNESEARKRFHFASEIDVNRKFVYPGFIDAHCHFVGYASDLVKCNLTGTNSWEDALYRLKKHSEIHPTGWLFGRGWDQNDWPQKSFPDNEQLNKLFPDRPVLLVRIDGHALIANDAALKIAGIDKSTGIEGGEILLKDGRPTGVFIDNAMELLRSQVPAIGLELCQLLRTAEEDCFQVGLTSVSDAGLTLQNIRLLDSLQKSGYLRMRVYAMVSDSGESKEYFFKNGPYKTERLKVSGVKYYLDGALGSRGACLLQPYTDKSSHYGFLLSSQEYFRQQAEMCKQKGLQMCVHAIGDSANRFALKLYNNVTEPQGDYRWRIEHCQILDTSDISMFANRNIIASVQPTHATSDMYWAEDRLGPGRMNGAYAYASILKKSGVLALGSDFPVESINPIYGFYAAVSRKDQNGKPVNGFRKEEALTREQGLRGTTIWAAYAAFEEKEKGSLEQGKLADFVVLDRDILHCAEDEIFKAKVLETWINGEKVYSYNPTK